MEKTSPLKIAGYSLLHVKLSKLDRAKKGKKSNKGKKNNKGKKPNNNSRPIGSRSPMGLMNFPFKTIHGIPLVEVEYKVPPSREREVTRSQFREIKGHFMKFMVEKHEDQLVELGFTQGEIEHIKVTPLRNENGRINSFCPNRYNIHHKLPIHGGGKNEFPNFIIMPLAQHSNLHTKVIDPQIQDSRPDGMLENMHEGESRKILIPYTERNAFISPSKIPGFDKSQDYESYQGGRRRKSRDKDIFSDILTTKSVSMEGEFDDEKTNALANALFKAVASKRSKGKN